MLLPGVRLRATGCGGRAVPFHPPPSFPLLVSFVFYKHKTWKWLRKMEPPNHCLERESVSRKHIGLRGRGAGVDGQLHCACWVSVREREQLAGRQRRWHSFIWQVLSEHLLCARCWAGHRGSSRALGTGAALHSVVPAQVGDLVARELAGGVHVSTS